MNLNRWSILWLMKRKTKNLKLLHKTWTSPLTINHSSGPKWPTTNYPPFPLTRSNYPPMPSCASTIEMYRWPPKKQSLEDLRIHRLKRLSLRHFMWQSLRHRRILRLQAKTPKSLGLPAGYTWTPTMTCSPSRTYQRIQFLLIASLSLSKNRGHSTTSHLCRLLIACSFSCCPMKHRRRGSAAWKSDEKAC